MTQNIGAVRPQIAILAGLEKPAEEYSLRDAVEWQKNVVRQVEVQRLGGLSGLETQQLDQSWMHLIHTIAERENLPAGFLAYMLSSLVQSEMQMLDTAQQEATP